MPGYKNVTLSAPLLAHSQLQFRLGLVRQRTRAYPLDSMDFIMMDLERPEGHHRHAYQCAGDLTGRLLEFLAHAEGVDGRRDERLPVLFERMLRQRRPSGVFGRVLDDPMFQKQECFAACARYFPGLIYYYELSNDVRALDAAVALADLTVRCKDIWHKAAKETGGRGIVFWIAEPMALLYGVTGQQAYLDFVGMIADGIEMPDRGVHAHGYMATLRGLQTAGLITGEATWNAKPEAARRMIIERHYEMPDGGTPEGFPNSGANEGCSIADWLMLNLNSAAITGDPDGYERAEHILWNALAFNQWNTGCFGHRSTSPNGYSMRRFEEAWWCCLHHGGLALVECARHAVTVRDNAIHVNFLVPGRYRAALPGGREVEVQITTAYPARAEAAILATGVPQDGAIRLRTPACVKQPAVTESRANDRVQVTLAGRLGHHVESCHGGVLLKYGPLVLAPAIYSWQGEGNGCYTAAAGDAHAPTGYIPESMPQGLPILQLPACDAEGLLSLSDLPRPDWMYFDDGPASRCGVAGSAGNVGVKFPDGNQKTLRFTPLCYNTSCLSLFDTPILFGGAEHAKK
ncbi:MAG: glycoside hydrolase family 127 protein [Planctomycetota bacterium]|nr:glycoside hydrolase family 127 protein [Planctomycetota bacterium]